MKNRNKILGGIVLLLILCTGISISYAFFKISKTEQNPNVSVTIDNIPSCVTLQMSNANIVSIANEYAAPISDAKALSSDVYRTSFDVVNNCDSTQNLKVLLAPTSNSTMPVVALKYVLVEQSETPSSGTLVSESIKLNNDIKLELKQKYNQDISIGYSVGDKTVPAKTTKSYYLYLWIDENEGGLGQNSTMNKLFEGYIVLGNDTLGKEIPSLYKTIQAKYNEGNTFVKLYDGEGSDTYANSVYYYNGAVEDNNVLFANFCWKIVRTTDTGGVKLIYNGVQKTVIESTPIEESEYSNLTNDETYPYTFDSTNKTWTSTNHDDYTISTIAFNAPENGDYILNYSLSCEEQGDYIEITKDGVNIISLYGSGQETDSIELFDLTTSNEIIIKYNKDGSISEGSDNVVFSLEKTTGNSYLTCNNTREDSQIGTSKFNSSSNSPAYVGYMYNTVYTSSSKSMSSQSNIVFGNSFTYSGGSYTLTNTMTVSSWSSGYNTINNNHYTCLTTGTTCSSLYYVYYTNSSYAYYITLSNGKSVSDALNEMLYADDVNKTNSTMKTYIETWYENNMTAYTSYLEDTTFCNDRSTLNLGGWNPNGGITTSSSSYLQFKNYNTNYSLVCTNELDQFRVENTKAPLKYPVGLLTAPEVWLAYKDASYSTYYLNTGWDYWLGSPYYFVSNGVAYGRIVYSSGDMGRFTVGSSVGARPSVSLKPGTGYTSGDGSYTSPYLIE